MTKYIGKKLEYLTDEEKNLIETEIKITFLQLIDDYDIQHKDNPETWNSLELKKGLKWFALMYLAHKYVINSENKDERISLYFLGYTMLQEAYAEKQDKLKNGLV